MHNLEKIYKNHLCDTLGYTGGISMEHLDPTQLKSVAARADKLICQVISLENIASQAEELGQRYWEANQSYLRQRDSLVKLTESIHGKLVSMPGCQPEAAAVSAEELYAMTRGYELKASLLADASTSWLRIKHSLAEAEAAPEKKAYCEAELHNLADALVESLGLVDKQQLGLSQPQAGSEAGNARNYRCLKSLVDTAYWLARKKEQCDAN